MPGEGLPWQVRRFAGAKEGRMPMYKFFMAVGLGGAAYWYLTSSRELERKQAEAVEKFGRHGEKVQYGDEKHFKEGVHKGEHFPGLPGTDTNAAGGHPGGTKP